MENQNLTIVSIEEQERNIDQQALPLFGENNDQLLPFWDWVEIRNPYILDTFHLRLHNIFIATADMSEKGMQELCYAFSDYEGGNTIKVSIRTFIELWTIARENSKELKALEAVAGLEIDENEFFENNPEAEL